MISQKYVLGQDLIFSTDYIDYAGNAGYKNYYLCGANISGTKSYFLTPYSSIIADANNYSIVHGEDLDFDLSFNNPITIANSDAILNLSVIISGSAATQMTIVINFYRVNSSGTEIPIGSCQINSLDADPTQYRNLTAKATLTRTDISIGEKLRISIALTNNDSGGSKIFIDPSGSSSFSGVPGTVTTRSMVSIPIEVGMQ